MRARVGAVQGTGRLRSAGDAVRRQGQPAQREPHLHTVAYQKGTYHHHGHVAPFVIYI